MSAKKRSLIWIERVLACFWIGLGLWVVLWMLRHPSDWAVPAKYLVGSGMIVAGLGLFSGRLWNRIVMAVVMIPVLLFCGDVILFLAFRGYYGQTWVPYLLGLTAAALLTCVILLLSFLQERRGPPPTT